MDPIISFTVPDWLLTTIIGVGAAVLLWWRKQASGLGFFQEATDAERDEVMKLMRERIDLLEQKVEQQAQEIKLLQAENVALRKLSQHD